MKIFDYGTGKQLSSDDTKKVLRLSLGIKEQPLPDPFADEDEAAFAASDSDNGPVSIFDIISTSVLPPVPLTTEQAQAKEIELLRARVAHLEQDAVSRRTVDTLREIIADGGLLYYLQGPAGDTERTEWADRVQGVASWLRDHARQERETRERWERWEGR